MRRFLDPPRIRRPRLLGGVLIATGLLGILLSFAGMVFTARAGIAAQQALSRQLTTLDRALTATAEGLTIADTALTDAERTLGALSDTIGEATQAISETAPTLDTLQDLTGTSLPASITSTREALDSARETARVADRVLGALSFLGLDYNPEVPLNVAIGRVSDSLAPVPAELANVSAGLTTAETSLAQVTANLQDVGEGIDAIAVSVRESAGVVEQYQEVVDDLRGEVAAVAEAAPGWIGWLRWGSFTLLVWMALANIGLLAQGWELAGRGQAAAGALAGTGVADEADVADVGR